MSPVEVLGPKGPAPYGGADLLTWARSQLAIAGQIVDNPGGGLLFATQTMGQVRAALAETGADRWQPLIGMLEQAEDSAVRRHFGESRRLLAEALESLREASETNSA